MFGVGQNDDLPKSRLTLGRKDIKEKLKRGEKMSYDTN